MIDLPKDPTAINVLQVFQHHLGVSGLRPPYLPPPDHDRDGYASIETALQVVGGAQHGDAWVGNELAPTSRLPPGEARKVFEAFVEIPEFTSIHDDIIREFMDLPEVSTRWRQAVRRLRQYLIDGWVHAIDPVTPKGKRLSPSFWIDEKRGLAVLEHGEVETKDGRWLRPLIDSRTLGEAVAATQEGVDVGVARAARSGGDGEGGESPEAVQESPKVGPVEWLESMKREWGERPPGKRKAYNQYRDDPRTVYCKRGEDFYLEFDEIIGVRGPGEKRIKG
ncbi:MAG: hypothetical protein AAGA21_24830 [Pseudomonadota bacterium]